LQILAAIRTHGGASQAVETLKLDLSDEQRFQVASLLPNFGAEPHAQAAFQTAFEALNCESQVDGLSVCERLAPFSVYFFDAALVPWLLDQATKKESDAHLSEANRASIARALSLAALRLGAASDNARLHQMAKQNELSDQSEDVLALNQACRDDLSCYLGTVTQLKEQNLASQILAQRSLVVLATSGGTTERDALIELLPALDDQATLNLALRAIDRLTPQSGEQAVSALAQYVAEMKADKDPGGLRSWTRELLASIETRPQMNGQEEGVVSFPAARSPAERTP
jgi:hypothetical protein